MHRRFASIFSRSGPATIERLFPWRAVVLLSAVMLAGGAAGQENGPPAAQATAQAESNPQAGRAAQAGVPPRVQSLTGRIRYAGPDTYIVLDAEGRPQPIPGLTYEDLMEFWRQSQGDVLAESEPRFSIETIEVQGNARSDRAELRFEAIVRLMTAGEIDVPLGLADTIVTGNAQITSVAGGDEKEAEPSTNAGHPGERSIADQFLRFDPDRGGFIARLSGRAGDRRKITLNLLVPITRDRIENTLVLNCARSVSSMLSLAIPSSVSELNVSGGSLVSRTPSPDGGTRLTVAGATGTLRLSWQTNEAGSPEQATALSAVSTLRAVIDGRSVRTEARLTLRSYGASFDRFRIRLPAGAQLMGNAPGGAGSKSVGYRILPDEHPQGEHAAGDRPQQSQIVLVEFEDIQQGPVVVELATEQPIAPQEGGLAVQLGGFEVLGAVRQFGDLAVEVANDWQARWEVGPNVRQVDPGELDSSLQQPGVTAAFQFDRQPWSLSVRVSARQPRVHVTPRYELDISGDEARLTARLGYQVFGGRAFEYLVQLAGWELTAEPIESGGLVDQDRVPPTRPDGTLVLPLLQASSRRAQVSFTLRRPISGEAGRLELPLPVALADSVGAGELLIRSPANIELIPDMVGSVGLSAGPAADSFDPAAVDNRELRLRLVMPKATFVAELRKRAREVTADVSGSVKLTRSQASVTQRVAYEVRNEGVKELVFVAPVALASEAAQLRCVLLPAGGDAAEQDDPGTPMNVSWATSEGDTGTANSGVRQLRAALPQSQLGRFIVRLTYRVDVPASALRGEVWEMPYVQPGEAEVVSVAAAVEREAALRVQLAADVQGHSWTVVPSGGSAERSGDPHVEADRAENYLPLVLKVEPLNSAGVTVVDRVWLQSWLSDSICQERAAFRLRTNAQQATIELPPRSATGELELLVDGKPAEPFSRAAGRVVVKLPGAGEDSAAAGSAGLSVHTVELRYRRRLGRTLITRQRFTPPQIAGTTDLSEVYWHIVLPADEHVFVSPRRLAAASRWQWLGSFWGLWPVMSQRELESWVSAQAQVAPAVGQNEYLFTGLAPVSSIELITAPRWFIVLGASGVVLLVGLTWVYIPAARSAPALVALALVIAALALAFPTPALLLAQASVLGVIVALLAVILGRLSMRPRPMPVILSTGSTQRQLTPRADSIVMPPVTAGASTAPTAPYRYSDSQ